MLIPPCNKPNGCRARSDIGIRRRIPSASAETITTPRASGAVFGSKARSCSMEVIRVETEDIRDKLASAPGGRVQLLNSLTETLPPQSNRLADPDIQFPSGGGRLHRDFQKARAATDQKRHTRLRRRFAVGSHYVPDLGFLDLQTERSRPR